MTIYYSATQNGFFDDSVGYSTLPDDIIEITPELHKQMLDEVNMNNKRIVISNGEISYEDNITITTWKQIRKRRDALLVKSDYTQMPDWPGDKQAWSTYRQQLRDIPQTYSETTQVIWPTVPK